MTTYTLPAYVIAADGAGIPNNAFSSEMVFVAPSTSPSFSYTVARTESFDGLGDANVMSLNQDIFIKTVDNGAIEVAATNYHAIFEVVWGGGNRSIIMIASAGATTRVGIVLDGDPAPQINSLAEYYAWVDTYSSLAPVSSGPFAPGQQIPFNSFEGVAVTAVGLTTGTPGDDFLEGGVGNDVFDGLGGVDTAGFTGSQDNFTLEVSGSGFVIEDRRAGGQGRDQLNNVEFLDFGTMFSLFGDQPVNLAAFDNAADVAPADFLEIVELYIAYFNRAPDAVGLLFWANAFAEGVTLPQMAAFFVNQDETRAAYPDTLSNADIVTVVYANVLGRVGDQEGIDFWLGALNAGTQTRDQFILGVLGGAKVDPPSGASQAFIDQQLADRAYLANKTDIGTHFAVTRGMSDVDNASNVMSIFNGSEGSINAAVAAADQLFNEAQGGADTEFLMPLIGIIPDPF